MFSLIFRGESIRKPGLKIYVFTFQNHPEPSQCCSSSKRSSDRPRRIQLIAVNYQTKQTTSLSGIPVGVRFRDRMSVYPVCMSWKSLSGRCVTSLLICLSHNKRSCYVSMLRRRPRKNQKSTQEITFPIK